MAKSVKLTKTELKAQKDNLKRYKRYLPTLQLKKQQLQLVIRQVEVQINEIQKKRDEFYNNMQDWISVFSESNDIKPTSLSDLVVVKEFKRDTGNIAGVDIPVFNSLVFEDIEYDFFVLPLWVDKALNTLKNVLVFDAQLQVLRVQLELLGNELRTTSQRVNLFEKVKIPETKANIRVISIKLGDEQTASVVRGKISKNKIVETVKVQAVES